jgi:glycosyltransferase involved in cell wall biosynthesis
VRVLVVSNMLPDAAHPERGRFVRDQVQALRRLATSRARAAEPGTSRAPRVPALDVELFEFAPGVRALFGAARELRRRYAGERFDVVHAHFGLSAYPALAAKARVRGLTLHGTDLAHPRTRLLTRAILPAIDLLGVASEQLLRSLPTHARARARVLPCGVDVQRFEPMPRARARGILELSDAHSLGSSLARPYLLFPADPARPEKRHDRARALADALGVPLLTLGGVAPERVPLYVNAANVVVVPSEREGFGLAVLEALACDVPVLATPVGIHSQALDGLAGCLCAPFELERWKAAAERHLRDEDARVAGRARAERFSSERAAQALAEAWESLLRAGG